MRPRLFAGGLPVVGIKTVFISPFNNKYHHRRKLCQKNIKSY